MIYPYLKKLRHNRGGAGRGKYFLNLNISDTYVVRGSLLAFNRKVETLKKFGNLVTAACVDNKDVFRKALAIFTKRFAKDNKVFVCQFVKTLVTVGKHNIREGFRDDIFQQSTVYRITYYSVRFFAVYFIGNLLDICVVGIYLVEQHLVFRTGIECQKRTEVGFRYVGEKHRIGIAADYCVTPIKT